MIGRNAISKHVFYFEQSHDAFGKPKTGLSDALFSIISSSLLHALEPHHLQHGRT